MPAFGSQREKYSRWVRSEAVAVTCHRTTCACTSDLEMLGVQIKLRFSGQMGNPRCFTMSPWIASTISSRTEGLLWSMRQSRQRLQRRIDPVLSKRTHGPQRLNLRVFNLFSHPSLTTWRWHGPLIRGQSVLDQLG